MNMDVEHAAGSVVAHSQRLPDSRRSHHCANRKISQVILVSDRMVTSRQEDYAGWRGSKSAGDEADPLSRKCVWPGQILQDQFPQLLGDFKLGPHRKPR